MRRVCVAPGFSPAGFVAAVRKSVGLKAAATVLLALTALGVPTASGQGTRKDDMVLNARGTPQAGASVAICTPGANTTVTPCSPRANIFKDPALTQALANPITTDGLGNYFFYAQPGKYTVQIYGPGIITKVIPDVILPTDLSGVTNVSGAIAAFSLSLSGNLTVTGSAAVTLGLSAPTVTMANQGTAPGTPSTGTVVVYSKTDKQLYLKDDAGVEKPVGGGGSAMKPAAGEGIQYVGVTGCNDANDGLSSGAAKCSLSAAALALPAANPGALTIGIGTIFVNAGAKAHATAGCGFYVMSAADPNYANPPACWLKRGPGSLTIIGYSATSFGPNAHMAQVGVAGPSNGNRNRPLFWWSGNASGFSYYNLGTQDSPGRVFVIGECSNGSRDGTCTSAGYTLVNVGGNATNSAGMGPALDVVGGFWGFFRDITFSGTESANGPTSDFSPAILFDGSAMTTFTSQALLFITDCQLANGGIKFKPAQGNNSLSVKNCTQEASTMPLLWIKEYQPGQGIRGNYSIYDSQTADSTGTTFPLLQVDGRDSPTSVTHGQLVTDGGRAVVSGPSSSLYAAGGAFKQQAGLTSGARGAMPKMIAQTDVAAWSFPPVAVRFTNLAAQTAATISLSGCTSCTATAVADPLGHTSAVRLATSSSAVQTVHLAIPNHSTAVGDWVMAALWVRSQTGNGFTANGLSSINVGGANTLAESGTAQVSIPDMNAADGRWTLVRVAGRLATAPTNPSAIAFNIYIDSAHTVDLYEPTMVYAGLAMNDEEAAEYAMFMQTWPVSAAPGDLTLHLGQASFAIGQQSSAATIPQQVIYDTFDRANGGLGSNWTTLTGEVAPTITSNQLSGNTGSYQMAYYSGLTLQADQFAQATAPVGGADGSHTFGLLLHGSGNRCYFLDLFNGTAYILRRTAGSNTTLASVASTPAAGSNIRFEISGTTLTAYVNGAVIATVTDSTYSTGQPGIEVFGSGGLAVLDNWSGGNISAVHSLNVEADWTKPQHFLGGAILPLSTVANLPSSAANGSQMVATDGTPGSNPCTGGGSGALAVRIGGAWVCK
jgi:hypothetical protein